LYTRSGLSTRESRPEEAREDPRLLAPEARLERGLEEVDEERARTPSEFRRLREFRRPILADRNPDDEEYEVSWWAWLAILDWCEDVPSK